MLWANIAQVILLSDVVSRRIYTLLARRYLYAMQRVSRATLPMVFTYAMVVPKCIKTILNRIFPYAMLSGGSKTTLNNVFPVKYFSCTGDILETILHR